MDATHDTKKAVTDVLNSLIETCKDGEDGFKTAAEKVKESSLKTTFSKYATQRSEFASELQAHVKRLGGDPETTGHAAASLHRGWISLKEALSKNEDKAIVDECESGEDAAVKAYREALGKSLPSDVEGVVRKQFSAIQEAHGVIRNLKHDRG